MKIKLGDIKMATNRKSREALTEAYGNECFVEKLNFRDGRILYTGQKMTDKMNEITYHHIKMKKEGGESTPENGALIGLGNHNWFHKQSKENQDKMNKAFQDYKDCKVVFMDDIFPEIDYKVVANHFTLKDLKLDKKIHDKSKQKNELSKITREYIDR